MQSLESNCGLFIWASLALMFAMVLPAWAQQSPQSEPADSIWTAEEIRLIDKPGELMVRLQNGMTAIVKEHHGAPVAAVRLFVGAGSIYEDKNLGAGLSHIFEHLLAGGQTETRSEEESDMLLQKIGGQWNAYTTKDHTCYYITTGAQHVGTALNLVADWVTRPTFPEASFDREWAVVQRELEMGSTDPQRQLYHLFSELRYQVHPARYPVIGHQSILQKVTREEILAYYDRMYVPDNTAIVVVGDFQAEEMLAAIRAEFADFDRRPVPTIELPDERPVNSPRNLMKVLPSMHGPARLQVGFPTIPLEHPDLYALDTLATVLATGRSSRLHRALVEEKKLAYSAYAYSSTPSYVDGTFTVGCDLDPARVDPARQAIQIELARLRDEPVTDDELMRAKRQLQVSHVRESQTAEGVASQMGRDYLSTGDPHFSDLYVQKVQEVTAQQLQAMARKYLIPQTQLTMVLASEPVQLADEQLAASQAESSDFKKIVLDNGLRVLLKRRNDVPLVSMQMYVLGGLIEETPENNGVTNLMAELSAKGTENYTSQQIAGYFDRVGGAISTGAGNNSFYYLAEVMPADMDEAIRILGEVVHQPTFPAEELAILRPQVLAQIRRIDDNWFSQAARYWRAKFYKQSPYQRMPEGRLDTVEAITPEQIAQWHGRTVEASRAVLAIVGDVDLARAEKLVRQHFDAMPAGTPLDMEKFAAQLRLEEPREFVEPSTRPGASVYLGYPGTRITAVQDRYSLDVLEAIIGATTSEDWFFERLRGAGLVYYARAGSFAGVLDGYFAASAQCEADQVPTVLNIMQELFARAASGDFTAEELARAKGRLISREALARQTNADLAAQAALDELYGLGYDWHQGYADRITALTLADVQAAAKKYLSAPPTVTVITSEPARLEEKTAQR